MPSNSCKMWGQVEQFSRISDSLVDQYLQLEQPTRRITTESNIGQHRTIGKTLIRLLLMEISLSQCKRSGPDRISSICSPTETVVLSRLKLLLSLHHQGIIWEQKQRNEHLIYRRHEVFSRYDNIPWEEHGEMMQQWSSKWKLERSCGKMPLASGKLAVRKP
jgi:hypothetical protein